MHRSVLLLYQKLVQQQESCGFLFKDRSLPPTHSPFLSLSHTHKPTDRQTDIGFLFKERSLLLTTNPLTLSLSHTHTHTQTDRQKQIFCLRSDHFCRQTFQVITDQLSQQQLYKHPMDHARIQIVHPTLPVIMLGDFNMDILCL